jgi:hypothetical protein
VEGYVYVMINPAFPGMVKIGRTINSPEERAQELNTTGVPDRFVVVHRVFSKDCNSLESELHLYLASFRYAKNREFFEISVEKAIKAFENFKEKWSLDDNLTLEAVLYAYKLNGLDVFGELKKYINRKKFSKFSDGCRQLLLSTLADTELYGDLRIGCIDEGDEKTDAGGFLICQSKLDYLNSSLFNSALANYYENLRDTFNSKNEVWNFITGAYDPLVNPQTAILLHAYRFTVRRSFKTSFNSLVRSYAKPYDDKNQIKNKIDGQTLQVNSLSPRSYSMVRLLRIYEQIVNEFEKEQAAVTNSSLELKEVMNQATRDKLISEWSRRIG